MSHQQSLANGEYAAKKKVTWHEPNKTALVVIFILTLQNIFIFFRHYFQGHAFPWDFLLTYHAVPYYWIELVKLGFDTSWIPFEGMGYPRFMNIQSGFFYPVFWLFVASNNIFTIQAAVIVQGVHVLLGAVGAAVCARSLGLRWRHALLAGVLYQGFGGFYSHASHPDIVRSYAFIPWMCAPVFGRWDQIKESNSLKFTVVVLPFFVYCAWTGGYPGVTIASFFILNIVLFTRMIFCNERKVGLAILAAFIAGTLLAAIFLAPIAMQVSEIVRRSSTPNMHFDYLLPSDLLSLVYSVDNLYFSHDVTMRSLFVGVPVIALVLIGLKKWRIWNRWVIFSGGLALGISTGLLHTIVFKLFPPIGFSRFPIADYGAFIALSVILLAATTSQFIQDTKIKIGYAWAILLLLFLLFGNQILKINGGDELRLFTVLLATSLVLGPILSKKPLWVVPAIIIISLIDWGLVHWSAPYFSMSQGQAYSESATNRTINRKLLGERLENTSGCRPARIDNPGSDFDHFSWRGYYSGEFMMQDYSGPMQFKRQQMILSEISLKSFAVMPWKMVVIPDKTKIESVDFQTAADAKVDCIHYGTSQIQLFVNMESSTTVVENEIYWMGWEAELVGLSNKGRTIIKAVDVNGFRGWNLPAGKYQMIEKYKTPYLVSALLIVFFGFVLWLCMIFTIYKSELLFNTKESLS